jgi:RNA polymerase sigma factor (sigma-70 family)
VNIHASDQEVMQQYLRGDSGAFDIIYRRYSSKVYGYLKKRIRSDSDRDEIFQAIWMKFHQSRQQYDPKFLLVQWVFVIARSVMLDHIKKTSRVPQFEEHESIESIPAEPEIESNTDAFYDRISALTHEQRQIIEMRLLNELSYKEIAEKLGHSQTNVRQIFSRALKQLRGSGSCH